MAVNKNGVRASLTMEIVPFTVSVSCQGIDNTDNSVSNIFSKWQLMKRGAPTHYKYSETMQREWRRVYFAISRLDAHACRWYRRY